MGVAIGGMTGCRDTESTEHSAIYQRKVEKTSALLLRLPHECCARTGREGSVPALRGQSSPGLKSPIGCGAAEGITRQAAEARYAQKCPVEPGDVVLYSERAALVA
jgi:hypothetical protein